MSNVGINQSNGVINDLNNGVTNVANNVAHNYLALTQGTESYNTVSAINLWKGNIKEEIFFINKTRLSRRLC